MQKNKIYQRNCPKCNSIINYKQSCSFYAARKKNTNCKKCVTTPTQFIKGQKSANTDSIYNCWLKKYGKDVADEKMIEFKNKQSFNNKGCKNSMYGKPSPTGSGNGWSGWYKNWYFRSLGELSYRINLIERFNLEWENAELAKYKIQYTDYKNTQRNYNADFIINNKYMVECKPKKLFKAANNVLKQKAAVEYCNNNNLIYKLTSPRMLKTEEIIDLYNKKQIKFIDRYEKKFKNKYCIPT